MSRNGENDTNEIPEVLIAFFAIITFPGMNGIYNKRI